MKDKNEDKYITAQRAAEILSCSDQQIYNLIQEGLLVAIKLGPRAIRISEKSLNAFVSENRIDPSDYYGPEEEKNVTKQNAPLRKNVARSKWMMNR